MANTDCIEENGFSPGRAHGLVTWLGGFSQSVQSIFNTESLEVYGGVSSRFLAIPEATTRPDKTSGAGAGKHPYSFIRLVSTGLESENTATAINQSCVALKKMEAANG